MRDVLACVAFATNKELPLVVLGVHLKELHKELQYLCGTILKLHERRGVEVREAGACRLVKEDHIGNVSPGAARLEVHSEVVHGWSCL